MSDWVKSADPEMVWRVCSLMKDECNRCPVSEMVGRHGDVTRGCYLHAVEVINTVQTGNPWRKQGPVRPPFLPARSCESADAASAGGASLQPIPPSPAASET